LGAGDIWEISVHSAQFFCESKTALTNKLHFFQKVKKIISFFFSILNLATRKFKIIYMLTLVACFIYILDITDL